MPTKFSWQLAKGLANCQLLFANLHKCIKYPGTAAYTVDNLYQNGYISNVKGTYTTTDNIFTATGYTIAKANFIYKSMWYNADRCLPAAGRFINQ